MFPIPFFVRLLLLLSGYFLPLAFVWLVAGSYEMDYDWAASVVTFTDRAMQIGAIVFSFLFAFYFISLAF